MEYRAGMLNISPVGRNCSVEERDAFEQYDKVHGVRKRLIEDLEAHFKIPLNLTFVIGMPCHSPTLVFLLSLAFSIILRCLHTLQFPST